MRSFWLQRIKSEEKVLKFSVFVVKFKKKEVKNEK